MKIVAPILFFLLSVCTYSQGWKETYGEALTASVDQKKAIILVFAGSDWCAPCMKLDNNIWQSEEFKAYSKENYILYKADFPRKKSNQLSVKLIEQNAALADRFNPKGHFPLVVVLNHEEKVMGKMGYKKVNPAEYISLLNNYLK